MLFILNFETYFKDTLRCLSIISWEKSEIYSQPMVKRHHNISFKMNPKVEYK